MSFFKYLRESAAELKHVSWPTSKQASTYTILVIIISLFAAAYTGVFDRIFTSIINATLGTSYSTVPQEIPAEVGIEGVTVTGGDGTEVILGTDVSVTEDTTTETQIDGFDVTQSTETNE